MAPCLVSLSFPLLAPLFLFLFFMFSPSCMKEVGAMKVCSENSVWAEVSPRISFSRNVSQSDVSESKSTAEDHHRPDSSLPLDMSAPPDFNFSLRDYIFSHDSSLADDLFSHGKLLPLQIKNPSLTSSSQASAADPPPSPEVTSACHRERSMASTDDDDDGQAGRRSSSSRKSFWRFPRNSSRSLCPLPLLRSKCSGSSPMQRSNAKQQCNTPNNSASASISKGNNDTNGSTPYGELLRKGPSFDPKTRVYYFSGSSRGGSYSNAVRVGLVLNVPTPSSTNFFSYLRCQCGDKNTGKSSAALRCGIS